MLTERHYRGQWCPPCRSIVYGGKRDGGVYGDWANIAFIHIEKDIERYCGEKRIEQDKLLSFNAPHRGVSLYRLGTKLFVCFNFYYFKSLMLINGGFGVRACFQNDKTFGTTMEKVKSMDCSSRMVTTSPLEEVSIDSDEAQSILDAMNDIETGKDAYTPLFKEEWEQEKPLWNSTKEYLKGIVANVA